MTLEELSRVYTIVFTAFEQVRIEFTRVTAERDRLRTLRDEVRAVVDHLDSSAGREAFVRSGPRAMSSYLQRLRAALVAAEGKGG